ncbi:Armadillo repeat-containing protein 2 [Podochytrium sp. JEL0797]|nr:Armadillo repeat-containing protein 2 [Podochytrium sp. JEL0797]
MAVGVCVAVVRLTRDDRVLGNAFKLMFKLSKSGLNDGVFGRYHGTDAVVSYLKHLTCDDRLLVPHKCDMAIYAVGLIKNLSSSNAVGADSGSVLEWNGSESIIAVLSRVAWILLNKDPIKPTTPPNRTAQITQLLIQIALTLRNLLSLLPTQTHTHLSTQFAPSLSMGSTETPLDVLISILMDPQPGGLLDSRELVLNVSRVLSKSSLDAECLGIMRTESNVGRIVDCVVRFQTQKVDLHSQPHLLRFLFVLVNLTTPPENEETPVDLCLDQFESYSGDFVALFWKYARKVVHRMKKGFGSEEDDLDGEESSGVDEESWVDNGGDKKRGKRRARDEMETECEDVLIKIVRLLSNLSVHHPIGSEMSQMIELELILDLIELASCSFPTSSTEEECAADLQHEELVLNLAGALANFTFYVSLENVFSNRKIEVLELMLPLLLSTNPELVEQATRVYSNLSRPSPHSRDLQSWFIHHRGGIELLSILLDHPSPNVQLNVAGTLLNLFTPPCGTQCARVFEEFGGVEKVTDLVETGMVEGDWEVAGVGCKVVVNLVELMGREGVGEEKEERLGVLMVQYLGEPMLLILHSKPNRLLLE